MCRLSLIISISSIIIASIAVSNSYKHTQGVNSTSIINDKNTILYDMGVLDYTDNSLNTIQNLTDSILKYGGNCQSTLAGSYKYTFVYKDCRDNILMNITASDTVGYGNTVIDTGMFNCIVRHVSQYYNKYGVFK